MKKKISVRRIGLLVLVVGVLSLTLAVQGSENDPLVTLGYLTERFLPQVVEQVEIKAAERDAALEGKIQEMIDAHAAAIDEKMDQVAVEGGSTDTGNFSVVTMAAGQKLIFEAGGEVLLRGGKATCVSSSAPGLIDMTGGETLADSRELLTNHLYLASIDGRGIKAATDATVLVRGNYILE